MNNTFLSKIKYPLIVAVFVVLAFTLIKDKEETLPYVQIAGQKIEVDLAITDEEHQHGLSTRDMLLPNQGMLFIFAAPGKYNFWMQGMNFPIDIIWISEDFKVVHIKKDARHETPFEQFGPEENAKYVLEVVSGFSQQHNLKVGDSVEIFK
jgi:uncharacterized membrane protein (UPF0127 family)